MNRTSWAIIVVASCGLTLVGAKPMALPGPSYRTGTIVDKKFSFAFDLPVGWGAEQAPGPGFHEYWIGKPRGFAFSVGVEPVRFSEPPADFSDSLKSYAAEIPDIRYSWTGNNGSYARSESLLSFRHGQTRSGLPIFEFTFRVQE